jgi:hypothetical protein
MQISGKTFFDYAGMVSHEITQYMSFLLQVLLTEAVILYKFLGIHLRSVLFPFFFFL